MIPLLVAATLSLGAVEESCSQHGDVFSCNASDTYEKVELVQTDKGCVEKKWLVTERKTTKRMWGDDEPFIEDVKKSQKLKGVRTVSKTCSAARAAQK